jgi:hypothetical protein
MNPTEIVFGLLAALLGGLVVAAANYYFLRRNDQAENRELRSESAKLREAAECLLQEVQNLRSEADALQTETQLMQSEAARLRENALDNRLETTRLTQELSLLSSTMEAAKKALEVKETVLYDSRQGFEAGDFEGQGSVIAGDWRRTIGQGKLKVENGCLEIERTNAAGGYIAHLRRYTYHYRELKRIPKNELISGKRKIRLHCEARVNQGACKFRFVLVDYPTQTPLEVQDFDLAQHDWTPIELIFKVSPSLDCSLQIHQASVSEPNVTQIRNVLLVEREN